MVLLSDVEKIRFNELHRKLNKYGAKMSKPTLIEHLNHLIEEEIILRKEEGKQKVSYIVNWNKFKQVTKAKKMNEETIHRLKNEKRFKIKDIEQQTIYTTAMLTIGELFYLKLQVLNIIEPENKLYNYVSYTYIRRLYNLYATWLIDTCKKSKENSKKVLKELDLMLKTYHESFLEKNPDPKKEQNKRF